MNNWIDKCTAWVNYLLRTHPEMISYSLKFCKERKLYTFMFYIPDEQAFMHNFSEREMVGPKDYEKFKKHMGVLFK